MLHTFSPSVCSKPQQTTIVQSTILASSKVRGVFPVTFKERVNSHFGLEIMQLHLVKVIPLSSDWERQFSGATKLGLILVPAISYIAIAGVNCCCSVQTSALVFSCCQCSVKEGHV